MYKRQALGWLVGFAGVLASASGLAINCLAKKSCHEQLKAEKKSHSDEAAGRFLERLFDSIQRLAWATASDVKIANFLKYVRTISIEAIQRSIEALAGLVHLAPVSYTHRDVYKRQV